MDTDLSARVKVRNETIVETTTRLLSEPGKPGEARTSSSRAHRHENVPELPTRDAPSRHQDRVEAYRDDAPEPAELPEAAGTMDATEPPPTNTTAGVTSSPTLEEDRAPLDATPGSRTRRGQRWPRSQPEFSESRGDSRPQTPPEDSRSRAGHSGCHWNAPAESLDPPSHGGRQAGPRRRDASVSSATTCLDHRESAPSSLAWGFFAVHCNAA